MVTIINDDWQVDLGITVVGDGEMSKPSYVSYVSQRLTGLVGFDADGDNDNDEVFLCHLCLQAQGTFWLATEGGIFKRGDQRM